MLVLVPKPDLRLRERSDVDGSFRCIPPQHAWTSLYPMLPQYFLYTATGAYLVNT